MSLKLIAKKAFNNKEKKLYSFNVGAMKQIHVETFQENKFLARTFLLCPESKPN